MSELQTLRDRVAELEDLMGLKLPSTPCRAVHLRPTEEKLCGLLVKNKLVNHDLFFTAVYSAMSEADWPSSKLLDVYICKLRKKLPPLGIEISTRWGVGYYLTADNKAKLAALLEDRV